MSEEERPGEGFFGRWSRRKRAAAAGLPVEEVAAPAPDLAPAPRPVDGPHPPPVAAAPAAEPPLPEPAFDPDSLPPVESLTAESDIAAFLRPEVPSALRHAALRRAWSLDPVIRSYVGPADYAWDFNAPDGVPGFAHALGGDLTRLLAQAVGMATPEAAEPPAEPAAMPEATEAEAAPTPAPLQVASPLADPALPRPAAAAVPSQAMADPVGTPEPEPPPPRPRRHGSARPA
ncbi:DUF3306 domain-containing protein [Paracraurococcus ruber]|uniref:DUF3306 domain-containing protein n=1 Tax=Paracraurococcus ruber TaxID=77675 RepID=UPI001907D0DB|nr:DUF3306 domain-containing protein [Paracraurococcus ruber]